MTPSKDSPEKGKEKKPEAGKKDVNGEKSSSKSEPNDKKKNLPKEEPKTVRDDKDKKSSESKKPSGSANKKESNKKDVAIDVESLDRSSIHSSTSSKSEPVPLKPPQVKVGETPKSPVPPLLAVDLKAKSPPKSVIIPMPSDKQIKLVKPALIITRIFGVTSSTAFGDDMFKYFISKFQKYISNHWTDPLIQEIVNGLRDQVKKEAISELPQIAASTEPKEAIIESIAKFINTRSEINKTKPKAKASRVIFPDYMKLKSIVIRGGLHNKDIIAHVYDDVPGAFDVWTREGKIKIHTLSSGPVDGQLDYFSNTSKGDLSKFITNGISTTNPQINSTETGYVNFRELAKKILQIEPNNILLLTDKVKDAQQAQKTDMNVVLISREGKLGHKSLSDDKEVLADFTIVTSFTSIVFKPE